MVVRSAMQTFNYETRTSASPGGGGGHRRLVEVRTPAAAERDMSASIHSLSDSFKNSIASSSFDSRDMEAQFQKFAQLVSRLNHAKESLAREALRSNAHSSSQQARLLREESEAHDEVKELEKALRIACDQAMSIRVEISKAEEEAEMRYLKFEVRALNLKVWEHLLQDPDCREVYKQKMKARTRPFGKFTHLAITLDDWIKLKKKLEWIEKALVLANEKQDTFGEDEKIALKETLKLKANIIHRYNGLNEIVFEENDDDDAKEIA